MALGAQFNDRAALQKARFGAMHKFLQEVAAAETAYCKAIRKGTERLQAFLALPEHMPASGAQAGEPADVCSVLARLCAAMGTVAEEHGSHAAHAYAEAVGQSASLTNEYATSSKAAASTAGASLKTVKGSEASLEKANVASERALTAFAEGSANGSDPWLAELGKQRAADELIDGFRQHQAKLEAASRQFADCECSGRSACIRIVVDTLSKVREMSERVQVELSRAHVALRGMECPQDSAYWKEFAEKTLAADTQAASGLWQKCAANALESGSVERYSVVSRPGVMKLTWSSQLAVLTCAGYLHLFEAPPGDAELPRLATLPGTSLQLRDCTVSVSDNNPASLKVEVLLHSKIMPSTRYTLKMPSEDAVVDWVVALKRHEPQESVWRQRRQRQEDLKNEKFLQKQGAKPRPSVPDTSLPDAMSESTQGFSDDANATPEDVDATQVDCQVPATPVEADAMEPITSHEAEASATSAEEQAEVAAMDGI